MLDDHDSEPEEAEPGAGEDSRDRLQLDPDAPPHKANEEMPSPEKPLKDQGDALEQG